MKKIRVITCQVIHQEWEYEVEVEDNFTIENILYRSKYLLAKISNDNIQGHCLDNDEVVEEILVECNEIEA